MSNPVTDNILNWQIDADAGDTNQPTSATAIGTGTVGDLAGELRRIKSEVRGESTTKSWERWKGLKNLAGTGDIAFTFVNGTTFTVNDNFTLSPGLRPVAIVGRRVRGWIASGLIYGTISSASWSSPNTTIVVAWDSGALDATLIEIFFGLEANSNSLVAAVAAKLAKAGDTMTGPLHIYFDSPTIYLEDSAGTEFAVAASGGDIIVSKNIGSHAVPNYTIIYVLNADGTPSNNNELTNKGYVDSIVNLTHSVFSGGSGDITITAPGPEDLASQGMTLTATIRNRPVILTFTGSVLVSNSGADLAFVFCVDGTEVNRWEANSPGVNAHVNMNGAWITSRLNGSHTFSVHAYLSAGTATIEDAKALQFTVTELNA